jgi:dihydroceramide fatty acyl 2-hydroxylase
MGGCSLWLMGGNLITWAGYFATGVFGWQLIEYSLHRFVFHMAAKSYAFIVFHFAMHGAHHKYPLDKMRLVFPPAPAAIIARIIYFGISSTLNEVCVPSRSHLTHPFASSTQFRHVPFCLVSPLQLSTSFAVMSGVVAGYVLYDCAHYWCHHSKNLPAFLEAQKRIHMDHHYRNHLVSFGISSPLYDYLFFTHPHKDGFKK